MKRNIFIILGTAFLQVLAMAAPNFSGSWVKDNAKSDPVPDQRWWLTRQGDGGRGGGGGRGGNGPAVVMTVQQDASSLQAAEGQNTARKFMLDGKPLTRNTETGMQKATVTASVQGEAIVIATSQPFGGMPGNATVEVKEVWSLSPDGKILTVTTTRTLPAQQKIYKQVYTKK